MTVHSAVKPKHTMRALQLREGLEPYLFQSPTIVLMAVLLLYPIVTVVRYSLFDNVITNKNPVFVGFQNYLNIFSNEIFWTSLGNTLFFTVFSVIFHLIIGLGFALLLNSKSVPSIMRGLLRVFYIMPWVFTVTIIAIIWRLLLNPSGVINYVLQDLHLTGGLTEWFSSTGLALFALTFVNIWAGYPFYMVSLLAGLQGVPIDLYEAAEIDGANEVQKFWAITIPQLSPIIISIAMLDFIWTMHVFPLVWMTTGGGPIHATEVLGTFTYKQAFASYQFSAASACAVIILVLSLSMAFFYVRHQKAKD